MRTAEEVLRDYLGQQVLNLAKLTAEVETLRAENLALKMQAEIDAIYRPRPTPPEAYEQGKGA